MRTTHQLAICSAFLATVLALGCRSETKETATTTPTWTGTGGGGATTGTGGQGAGAGQTGTGGQGAQAGQTGTGGQGGEPPDPCQAGGDHLLISEIGTAPEDGEFIEIWNRGGSEIDLSAYYLSDNSVYYDIAAGKAWSPITDNPNSDFLVQFPPGTKIGAGKVLVVQAGKGFETFWKSCPDFVMANADITCGGDSVPAMAIPKNGGLGTDTGKYLTNDREMLVLFCWGGKAATVKDVDYVTWGTTFEPGTRADKSGVAGYQADTAPDKQKPAPSYKFSNSPDAGTPAESIARAGADESAEKSSGGNGLSGHDETSEDLGAAFSVQQKASPGVAPGGK
ncbi:MAG: lamin tail domain-containing protein [Deltaproteobacteria bacterium]|nr:lamin tail domain-containing protein [Deltaproteobacteria bacterium]